MDSRLDSALSEAKTLVNPGRLRRFALPLGLMLIIVVLCVVNRQQQRTIDAQSELIHTLFADSLELSAKRMQQHQSPTADFKKPEIKPEQKPAPKKTSDQ